MKHVLKTLLSLKTQTKKNNFESSLRKILSLIFVLQIERCVTTLNRGKNP